jgi:cytochrome c
MSSVARRRPGPRTCSAWRALGAASGLLLLAGCEVPPGVGPPVVEAPPATSPEFERGRLLSLACMPCHTLGPGEQHGQGPNLHAVLGQPAASRDGFAYSEALTRAGIVWSPELLDRWLTDPAALVPGNAMVFAGYAEADDRRALASYLEWATSRPAPK